MTFNEYQEKIKQFDVSNGELWYYILGLAGEVGELAEKVKKFYRDGTPLDVSALRYEMGDIEWYLARAASKCGIELESVAQGNIEKLSARLRNNVLHGSGDYRGMSEATANG